jgi:hypothetical protein
LVVHVWGQLQSADSLDANHYWLIHRPVMILGGGIVSLRWNS